MTNPLLYSFIRKDLLTAGSHPSALLFLNEMKYNTQQTDMILFNDMIPYNTKKSRKSHRAISESCESPSIARKYSAGSLLLPCKISSTYSGLITCTESKLIIIVPNHTHVTAREITNPRVIREGLRQRARLGFLESTRSTRASMIKRWITGSTWKKEIYILVARHIERSTYGALVSTLALWWSRHLEVVSNDL